MSIWGTIIGGAAGMALGGPIGALLGAAAVHYAGKASKSAVGASTEQAVFAAGFIALCAKMAKADGVVTRDEINVFKKAFHVPQSEVKRVGWFFDMAKKEVAGFEGYATQLYRQFHNQPAVLEQVIDLLFHIAMADGVMHPAEMDYLHEVARIFRFPENEFARIKESHMGPDESDPYTVLGVSHDASDKEIKSAYRKQIKEHHPDLLMAQGVPEELIDVANEKMTAINDAYDKICKIRNIK
ncbi:TerB family tellurite resistance protein [Pseudemcibacter aquimaris]|uniref:TerB family tellurite resistance protein n=1 Tax=Pseudemcibacter aquimaris TaxID=2857064 RepID=UPI00237E2233|nr:TerB family tellurite resistance protein [Pseudemcibacter aquimaris]WDU58154.1 TerB family tellurite resistance protein [Pseudemcibacter aquimaris]